MKKQILILLIIATITFACKSPVADVDDSNNDYWSKFENWDKEEEVELKIENLVGTWVRKDTRDFRPAERIELIITVDKKVVEKHVYKNGTEVWNGNISIDTSTKKVTVFTRFDQSTMLRAPDITKTEIYLTTLYKKYWSCKEKKSGAWKSTEPLYKIK